MELQKRIYLASFLQRSGNSATLNEFCKLIKASAPEIISCYEETYYRKCDFKSHQIQQNIPPSDDNLRWFIEMVLADAAFIIELFLRIYYKEGRSESETDFVFDSPGKIYDIRRDLFLAHNQLPLFVLKQIYELAFGQNPLGSGPCPSVQHSFDSPGSNKRSFSCKPEFKWSSLFSSCQKTEENPDLESGRVQSKYLYSATLLRAAGVKFRVSSSRCLLDIKFNKTNGELKIPPLKVDESTEPFFRNIVGVGAELLSGRNPRL
ncbi:Detected protein of unknown function [Hibiscus syriacus]|uniref:Uncharacterized protein n=1 Tax=Hibiscus syriacus TaxID=106335 RepID=A0A6A2WWL8_HIBSY|nr:Detected protein of unknown function [Hibiscus syriacus]